MMPNFIPKLNMVVDGVVESFPGGISMFACVLPDGSQHIAIVKRASEQENQIMGTVLDYDIYYPDLRISISGDLSGAFLLN